ncbi:MAG: dihydroxyacetone kinase subunit DhaL [Bowdeniella nasicola]|nr:dihydroxyacetone kinase subunit DhaL [Bowdeniella nasicola]
MTPSVLPVSWAVTWLSACARAMRAARSELMELDRAIGDGDHGDNMDRGFSAVNEKLPALQRECDSVSAVLRTVAMTLMSTVGGAAGPLYGTAFLRASSAIGRDVDSTAVANLLTAAATGVQARGKCEANEKTMVDAWLPAAAAATDAAARGADVIETWQAAAQAAARGSDATVGMLATKGRASYLAERSIGHRDPGAASTALIIELAAKTAKEWQG